jgi:predicted ATPase/DNA-binding SARP family transcriptional activator
VDRLWKELAGTAMEFAILGPLEVRDGPAPVRVPGAKERALLADLLVNAGRVVPADRLVEDLWGDDPPGNPANTLQGRVSALRRALGPAGGALATRPPGYVLEAGPEQVDAGRFERLVAEATAAAAGEGPRAARQLEEALGLWRGPALAEFADQPWAQAEAARLEELRLAATEALVELRLAAGGHAGLVGELEGLVAAHPTRERLRGQLMVALYRSGRQADALGAYQRAREVLAEELGIDPSPELQRLHHQILLQDPALEAAAPDRALPRHNLPERLTSLVGREGELREVAKLVEEHRLVTVTGPGGAGKTSLAVALAGRLAAGHPDGVWLVELAALREPALLGEAVAAVLGLEEVAGRDIPPRAERLASFLPDKAMLLVLDNCEHLVEACAGLARRLLEAAPRLRVLATSREVLGVPGEVVWPIPPLALPAPDDESDAGVAGDAGQAAAPEALAGFDAVRLFVERASSADPGFVLDAASAPVVAELCRRLDGLPLAIELAAARTRALPPAELAARLEDRFRLLAGGARALDPRQQTLRATVDWSWDLLEERDRRLLRRLSVFSGGWTVAAAEAVCGGDGLEAAEVLDGLFRLVDRSLVVAAGGDPARFTMLETLRAYGAERLAEAGESGLLAARHTAWCLELAEQAAAYRTARPWLRRVAADYANLRAALDRTVAGREVETALRLAAALAWFWWTTHTIEGRQRMAGVLALADGQPPTLELARALQASAMLEVSLTPTAATVAAAQRSQELLERFGDRPGAAFSKLLLAYAELQRTGPGEAIARLADEAYTTFREAGDPWGEAYAERARFAFEAYYRGVPERAEESGQRAVARFQELDDPWGLAQAQFSLAEFAKARGDLARARGRLRGRPDRRPRRRAAVGRAGLARRARRPGRAPGRRRPGGRPARRGGRPHPPHRRVPRVRAPLQRPGRRRPCPRRPRTGPPAAPGGPGHPPRGDRLERPPHPRPARLRRGPPRRPRRRHGPPPGGGRSAPGRSPARDGGVGAGWRGPGRHRPRPIRAGGAAAGRRRGDPRAHRHGRDRRRTARGRPGRRRRQGRARPGRPGRRPGRRARPGHRRRPAGSDCQRLSRGRP